LPVVKTEDPLDDLFSIHEDKMEKAMAMLSQVASSASESIMALSQDLAPTQRKRKHKQKENNLLNTNKQYQHV